MTLKLALRNLFRNSRRTVLNLFIMAGGFVAVVVFQGFAANIVDATKWGAVESQYGHIQVATKKLWEKNSEDGFLERQLKNPTVLREKIKKLEGVRSVSLRQSTFGLISSHDRSVAAQIIGYEPLVETELLNSKTVIEGETFIQFSAKVEERKLASGGEPHIFESVLPVAVGEGLAKSMGLRAGDTLTLIGQTADGGINALDTEVISIFRTIIQEIDDTTVFVPIAVAQKLLDTESAERVIIKLKEHDLVPNVLANIQQLSAADETAKTWRDLARLYNQTEAFFESQNAVVAAIIFSLIFLSTMSAVSMSVSERTGEIGTLRAIGRSRNDVKRLFMFEGVLLGVGGSIVGALLSVVVMALINRAELPIVLPGATEPIPISINFVSSAFITAFLASVIAALFATYFAVRRVVGMKIVESLKHNI